MTTLAGMALVALLLSLPFFLTHVPVQAFAEEDSDSKGDISTETNANLGQMKEQNIVQDQKQSDRSTEKKEPSTGTDRPANSGHTQAPPERPQRFERPMRPERPHR